MFGLAILLGLIPVQRAYNREMAPAHRRRSGRMIIINRIAVLMIFTAVGINAWVLLIEINR